MKLYNIICPSCQNEFKQRQGAPECTCDYCEAYIIVNTSYDGIWAWTLHTIYKEKKYIAIFYVDKFYHTNENSSYFTLECQYPDGSNRSVLTLPFFPKINAGNFQDKLKIMLTFL